MAARAVFYSTEALNRSDEFSPESLAAQRAEYLKRGGKIEEVPSGLPMKEPLPLRSDNRVNRGGEDE